MALSETGNRKEVASHATLTAITTASVTFTAGNLVVATTSAQSSGATPAITDSNGGNTWHQAGSTSNGGSGTSYLSIFYCYNCIGAAYTVTSTWLSVFGFVELSIHEFHDSNGAWSTDPFDACPTGVNGSSTTPTSSSVTVTGSEDVIVFMGEADGQGWANGAAGYTVTGFAGEFAYFGDGYHIVTASEAAAAACTSGAWRILAASFKGVTGGGGTRGLFRKAPMDGLGTGGSFFHDPMSGAPFSKRDHIYVPAHMSAA